MAQRQSRRAVIAAAAGAVTASAVGAVAGPARVLAAGNDGDVIKVAGVYKDARHVTIVSNSNTSDRVFELTTDGTGDALLVRSNGGYGVIAETQTAGAAAVAGSSRYGVGVYGGNVFNQLPAPNPGNVGVFGFSDRIDARAVYGQTTDTSTETYGVFGTTEGSLGRAVFGWSLNETFGGTGVFGQCGSPSGVAVRGYAWDGYGKSGKFGTGVIGSSGTHAFPPPTALRNTGVYGVGRNGRGVVADGDRAQLRLIPSSRSNHPPSGAIGDFFLDKSNRLWFCKGRSTWVKLA